MNHQTRIVGLAVMGQRMLPNMTRYDGFAPVAAWDPNPEVGELFRPEYPTLTFPDVNFDLTASEEG